MPIVEGEFEVRRDAQPALDLGDGAQAAHLRFDKTFRGPLEASSVVHMLAVGTATEGSAAYVAVEHVVGTLAGRAGSFLMHHTGVMDRGTPSLAIGVVPDSGTGALAGLGGALRIDIIDGRHRYAFDYTLPDATGGTDATAAS